MNVTFARLSFSCFELLPVMDARFVDIICPGGVDPLLSRVRIRKSHATSWEILRLVTVYNATAHVLLCWVTLMPGSVMTAGLHHGVVTEDIRLRILECAHPRWYDHLIRLSHKL